MNNEEPNKTMHHDEPNKTMHHDEPNKTMHHDEPNKTIHHNEPNKTIHHNEPNKTIHHNEPNKTMHHNEPDKTMHHNEPDNAPQASSLQPSTTTGNGAAAMSVETVVASYEDQPARQPETVHALMPICFETANIDIAGDSPLATPYAAKLDRALMVLHPAGFAVTLTDCNGVAVCIQALSGIAADIAPFLRPEYDSLECDCECDGGECDCGVGECDWGWQRFSWDESRCPAGFQPITNMITITKSTGTGNIELPHRALPDLVKVGRGRGAATAVEFSNEKEGIAVKLTADGDFLAHLERLLTLAGREQVWRGVGKQSDSEPA